MKHQPAATASFTPIAHDAETPTFDALAADPEIAALLDFESAPRRFQKAEGWTPQKQRIFIALLTQHGSPRPARRATSSPEPSDAVDRQPPDEPQPRPKSAAAPPPGQVLNEHGEYEDQASLDARVADARDRITMKLLNARRLYLAEVCGCPGKRAAFEILTRYPIDWDRARRLEPQDDEPWRIPAMRTPTWC